MKIRFLFLIFSLIAIHQSGQAQSESVRITIIIPPAYSPYLQDYLQYENKMVIQLQNLTTHSVSVKLVGSIEGDNGILLVTNEDYAPTTPILIPANGLIRVPASSHSRGFFDPNHIDYTGPENLEKQILKDGILPEGNYMVCLEAVDFNDNTLLSAPAPDGCTLLPIGYPTPPEMVAPECEENLDEVNPFFQWTLPGGNTGTSSLVYDLYIVEYLEGSNPQDLMALAVDYNAGNSIIRKNLPTPSYQYQVTDPRLKEGATYLWSVRVRDRLEHLLFENNGLSEICLFTYHLENRINDLPPITDVHSIPNHTIQQVRTHIDGKLLYKFPGENNAGINAVPRSLEIQTEPLPYQVSNEAGYDMTIFNEQILALAYHDYINAFPVSSIGAQPLRHLQVKLIESWVITDCNVTFLPQGTTVHKDFFILPNETNILGGAFGGTSLMVAIDGITDTGEENPLAFGQSGINADAYNRILSVAETDGNGNYHFNFTQSSPGIQMLQYQGHASILLSCEPMDIPVEINEYVDPLDLVSNPLDEISNPIGQYYDQHAISFEGINLSAGEIGQTGGNVLRMGHLNQSPEQLPYQSVDINGGHLYKVLRLEVASPFYYSPDLIFWTHPGDTVSLPDQVSYVKSVDLDLQVNGGKWEGNKNYQIRNVGTPIPGVDVVYSRLKEGLPKAIPIEEGQGLRDDPGENPSDPGYQNYQQQMQELGYGDSSLYDSVSVETSNGDGNMMFTRLVAGHPYYIAGANPLNGDLHYEIPLQTKLYQIFDPGYCQMNLGTLLNSFCGHKAIQIRDTVTAYPLRPRVFGRVVTSTEDALVALANAEIHLKRFENGSVKTDRVTFSDEHGRFQFDNLPVNENLTNDYTWRIYFSHPGYENKILPGNNGFMTLKPGMQWDLNDQEMKPLGLLTGFIKDEDGRPVQALVRLANGPHVQTDLVSPPMGEVEFCGDVNDLGDAVDESTKVNTLGFYNPLENMEAQLLQSARFALPAQSGNNLQLLIIPLPEQYFQDTCMVNVENISSGDFQNLGFITVIEKLHRLQVSVKGPDGNAVQAKVYIDDRVRQTNPLGWTAFRFASAEINYRLRIIPELSTLVPVDTIISIPVTKTYQQRTFQLRQGKRIQVLVVRDQSGGGAQSADPIPIPGVVVQTLLSSFPTGDSYISCITGPDGKCVLEGVPASPVTADVSVWKQDDGHTYIGKTVQVSTNRPFNPPFQISMKVLSGVEVSSIWGFPVAITDMEIKDIGGGVKDTLLEGILTALPENSKFKSADPDIQIPFPKIKFKYAGNHNEGGRKILEPVNTSITLQQSGINAQLFEKFDVTVWSKRQPNGPFSPYISLKKINANKGNIEGTVETELSSFNTSYQYDGQFFLGNTPTDYNIDVFQSGYQLIGQTEQIGQAVPLGNAITQEPEPGPDDFYLMDIGINNVPKSQHYRVFQFDATSDSSRSFVNHDAFYVHTILHTDIEDVFPADLKLSVGKIKVTPETIESFNTGSNKLDFRMGSLWHYQSTTPYIYDPDIGAITAAEGYIRTGSVDIPMRNPIIKPHELIMNDIDQIHQLTLAGIKNLEIEPEVNIVLSHGTTGGDRGWQLNARKLNGQGVVDDEAVVAKLYGLPSPLKSTDKIAIHTIILNSEDPDLDLNLDGQVRPFDIADFTVYSITTGAGYFTLTGPAALGREGMRVPGMQPSAMSIQYSGSINNLTGKIVSPFTGSFETSGQVNFTLEINDGNKTSQKFSNQRFVSTGIIKVYEGQNNFTLHGILDVTPNDIKIHVIDHDLNIPNIDYVKADQPILLGSGNKELLVRSGLQVVENNAWQSLSFEANMNHFTGVKVNQPPMTFLVHGAMETLNDSLKVDKINLGFADISLTYNFNTAALTGYMNFDPPSPILFGPVAVDKIEADILVDPNGFLFAAVVEGYITEAFPAYVGILLGSHNQIPNDFIRLTMSHAKNKRIPSNLTDHEINGFFITGRVDLIDVSIDEINLVIFRVSGGASVGFDARVYMDFSKNGDAAFGFGALAYAGAMVQASLLLPPVPCPDPSICLAAEVQLLLEADIRRTGGSWVVSGHGCGSLHFSAAICGLSESIGGKADINFSSDHDPDIHVSLGESCTGGTSSEFQCK